MGLCVYRFFFQITFQRPVNVGDLLRLKACVLHASAMDAQTANCIQKSKHVTEDMVGLLHVEVNAYVTQPENATSVLSNTFNFRFGVERAHADQKLKKVLPETEVEARRIWDVVHMGI